MARAIKITSVSGALTVTITGPNGGTPVVYADSSFSATRSMPATIADTATTTFWLQGPGRYTLSVKTSGGTEIAADNNSTRTVDVETDGTVAALNYDARTLATVSGDSGHSTASSAASGAGLPTNFLIKTTTYAATAGDYILADATSAGFTVTLPTSPTVGALVAVEKTDTGANIVTVSPAGGGTIGGDPNATIITKSAWVFEHSGSNAWRVAAGNGGAANGVTSFNTRTGAVTLSKADVTNTGLGAADVGAAALEGTTAPPSTNTTGSVLGVATTGAHSDHTHAVGSHDHSTTAKGGQITPTTGLAATGTPSTTTYLRGDNTWGVPAGGSATTPAGTAMVMASGNWTQVFMGRNATATIGSNQSLMGFPFILANAATITTIGLHVNTAGAASSTIRLGIYSTTNGAPASLLVDAGTQAADTTGDKSWTLGTAQALSAGTLYYLAFLVLTTAAVPVIQAGTNTLNSPGTLAVSLPIGSTAAYICAAACCVHNVAVTGALPGTFTPSFSAANRDTPCVAFLAQ